MLDNKFLITLLSLVFATVMICNNNKNIKENFVDNNTFKVVRECEEVEDNNVTQALNSNIFKVPGTFDSVDNRRVHNLRGGAHLKRHVDLNNIVKDQNNLNDSCNTNLETYPINKDNSVIELPPNDMTLPKQKNVKCIERLMFANKKSWTRSQGCPIRGDLAIPHVKSHNGWFQVSANPTLDLHQGGIYGISGHHDKDMVKIMKRGGKTTAGGGDISNINVNGVGVPIDTIQIDNFP